MINIQPYIDRLDVLKEYMCLKIDGKGKLLLFDIDSIPTPNLTPSQMLDLFYSTGVLLTNSLPKCGEVIELTFEQYLTHKQECLNN